MAFRIADHVVRGEIDNRDRGRVTGRIWLHGRDEPLRLDLQGNALRDIAGSRLCFECPRARPMTDPHPPASEQVGVVGDITASRKVKTWALPFEEAWERKKAGGDVPTQIANCLYLEWFSERNGRVVVETVDFRITELTEPEWRMTEEEERRQCERNAKAIADFVAVATEAIENARESAPVDDDGPMDEFEWERFLKDSDERSELHRAACEKYEGHPDAERLIAREMGWDWLDDALDADARGAFDEARAAAADEPLPELVPRPETEGVDWIRTENGDVRHPLAHRAAEASIGMWHVCKDLGLLGDDAPEAIHEMTFQSQMFGAKLAGALNALAYDDDPDRGFVIACLKRALTFAAATLAALEQVRALQCMDGAVLNRFGDDLFEMREEALRLMERYRGEL